MFQATTRRPWDCAAVRNGSTTQAASTRPAATAAGASGKASSRNLTDFGSPPSLRTDARTVVSPMFLRLFTDTVWPLRSLGDFSGLSALTTTPEKSLPTSPVEELPLAR